MLEPWQKANDDFQKIGKDNYEAILRSYGELTKRFQAIATRMTDYSKRAFEDATNTFEPACNRDRSNSEPHAEGETHADASLARK